MADGARSDDEGLLAGQHGGRSMGSGRAVNGLIWEKWKGFLQLYVQLSLPHPQEISGVQSKRKKSVPSSLHMLNHKSYLIISLRRHCRRGQRRRAWGYMSRPTDGSPHRHEIDRQSPLNARPTDAYAADACVLSVNDTGMRSGVISEAVHHGVARVHCYFNSSGRSASRV